MSLFYGACLSTPSPSQVPDDASTTDARSPDAARVDAAPMDAGTPDASTDALPPCTDPDNDGYLAMGCSTALPFDCAPSNPGVHPGALEVCGNGMDEDCLDAGVPYDGGTPGDMACAQGQPGTPVLGPNMVTEDGDSNGRWVTNDFIAAWFHQVVGWSLREFWPSGVNELGPKIERDLVMLGSQEQSSGVLLWNSHFSVTPSVTPTVEVLASGPAVLRQRVSWSSGGATGVTGVSIYTVTPDGRIHRDESVNVGTSASGNFLTAYVALDPTKFDEMNWSWNVGAAYQLFNFPGGGYFATGTPSPSQTGYSCAYHTQNAALVGFSWRATAPGTTGGPRVTHTDADGTHIALQFDWYADETVPQGDYTGNFLMFVGYMGLSVPCQPVNDHAQAFLTPAVMIAGADTSLVTDHAGDDDADGYSEGGGFYTLRATGTAQSIAATVSTLAGTRAAPVTSLFRLEGLPASTRQPVVTLGGNRLTHGEHYFYQQPTAPDTATWLYLDVRLAHNDAVIVTLPPDN